MAHRFGMLRRFRFNLPQRIAAALLAAFLLQGFWLVSRQTLTDSDYQYARCGRETWEKPSPLAGYYTSCGNIHDGILVYRLAGLPLTLNLLLERGFDLFRSPENRLFQNDAQNVAQNSAAELSTWELRHQMTHILLLLRLPFLFAGFLLGGCIWWVTRRLYGNLGGYTALALYCFSPAILKACVAPNPEVLAALGVFGGIYTCIGVAHSMQGPARKWRPRIVLLSVIFGVTAAAHIAALPVAALLGLAAMLWIAEGHRSQALPVVLLAAAGGLVIVFACYGFSPDAFSYVFRSSAGFLGFSIGSRTTLLFNLLQQRTLPGLCRRAGPLSCRAQVALLRQHRASALCIDPDAPRDDWRARISLALVAALSAHLRRGRLCRRVRRPTRQAGSRRRRSNRVSSGSALHSQLAAFIAVTQNCHKSLALSPARKRSPTALQPNLPQRRFRHKN
jgi:hypothetical protein